MLIAQISDPHITTEGTVIRSMVDTPQRLIDAFNTVAQLPRVPDLILLTGDLVNDGRPEEYELLATTLEHAPCPILPIPGNHDDPVLLSRTFTTADCCPVVLPDGSGPFHYVVDTYPVRMVGLDSTVAGHHSGEITSTAAEWLDDTLSLSPTKPTIVFTHHTPYPTGAWWFDYNGVAGAKLLRSTLERHGQVIRVVAGHVHQASSTQWGSLILSTAPSTAFLSGPGDVVHGSGAPPIISNQRCTVPLFTWTGDSLLATETPLPHDSLVIDFRDINSNWDKYEAVAKRGGPISKVEFGG